MSDKISSQTKRSYKRISRTTRRRGSLVVWCAFLLVVLVGMVGLVIDGGIMFAAYRHSQNAADAAALAAAAAKHRGQSDGQAITIAQTYVTAADHNNLTDATVTVNLPPSQGAYAGSANYAEAIVSIPVPTYFIHVLGSTGPTNTVTGRAVAGLELASSGAGVMTLDPNAKPGLKITGEGSLIVEGDVIINSEGGGVDENGESVDNGNNKTAAFVSNNGTLMAANVTVVGGVNDPSNFENVVPGGDNPLHANQLPAPDPLLYLPTPTVSNGVVNVNRGAPQASDGSLALNNSGDSSGSPNYIEVDPITGAQTMVLQPGIYTSIKVTGGRVRFEPGVYVLKPETNTTFTLEVTGGDVTAQGIMFYNTGSNYDPISGAPDNADMDSPPASSGGVKFGMIKINASVQWSPLDATQYNYGAPVAAEFNGMLFYQRRWNTASMQIEGNSSEGDLAGTLYAKWAPVKIAGQGTYDAQFVVGSMDIAGQGDVTIIPNDDLAIKLNQIYLVE